MSDVLFSAWFGPSSPPIKTTIRVEGGRAYVSFPRLPGEIVVTEGAKLAIEIVSLGGSGAFDFRAFFGKEGKPSS